jgi:hypothetical protein
MVIIGLILLLFMTIPALIIYQRSILLLKKQMAACQKQLTIHDRYLADLVKADLTFARQSTEVNRQLISMDNQLQSLENKKYHDGGYQHALRILSMGGDKDEIMSSCSLSNAEAELLMNLQAYQAAIKTTP